MKNTEFPDAIQSILRDFETKGKECAQKMAVTGHSLVQNRIQKYGVENKSYSTNRLPAYWFEGKSLNAGGRQYIAEQKESSQGISYSEWRVANGLQRRIVDLTFSARMWAGITLLQAFKKGTAFVAQVGATDGEVSDKIGYNIKRYGADLFDPNQPERQEVDEIAEDFLDDFLNSLLDV